MTKMWVNLGGDIASLEVEGQISVLQEKQLFKRAERNFFLSESDSMVLPDRGLTDANKKKWEIYRQSLRDIDFSDPDNITWPNKP